MGGKYKKYMIPMELKEEKYRLWRRGVDEIVCFAETYREKRSLYFSVTNLQPSTVLMEQAGREYHLVLLGSEGGELLHKDFGVFFVNRKGDGGVFKKFSGPDIECYTHCLLVSLDCESGKTETVCAGAFPFYEEKISAETDTFETLWGARFAELSPDRQVQAFSASADETGALWFRCEGQQAVPEPLLPCKKQIERFGHFLLGRSGEKAFAAVPGRFLLEEQPCRAAGFFTLWQPVKGGEIFYTELADMTAETAAEIFGYWIAEIDCGTGELISL